MITFIAELSFYTTSYVLRKLFRLIAGKKKNPLLLKLDAMQKEIDELRAKVS